ncbi:hypothetical protein LCGC14_0458220 [marine sediment metagenome]|uniref:Uncharacterized protein n=1 Tax=marine sediment metagenome TaxID=412755 RepID=A0A0F9SLA7_9ZZZZ
MGKDFVSRHAASRVGVGVAGPARVNQAGEVVPMPLLWQLASEGRVFIGGHGIEETATDSETTLSEQTPSFALFAPAAGTVVLPIAVSIRMHADGGAASEMYAAYVQADRLAAGSGTSMDALNTLGGPSPRTSNAILEKTLSATTAIPDDENVMFFRRANILDNIISAEMATLDPRVESPMNNSLEFTWLPPGPVALYKGSGIAFWNKTGSTDATYTATFYWAELPSSVYLPDNVA